MYTGIQIHYQSLVSCSDQRRQGFLDSHAVKYVGQVPGSINTHALAHRNGLLWVTRQTQFLHMGWKVKAVVPKSRALSIRGMLRTYSIEAWNAGVEVGIDGDVCTYYLLYIVCMSNSCDTITSLLQGLRVEVSNKLIGHA